MLIFFDIATILLREQTSQTGEGMRSRHANLEQRVRCLPEIDGRWRLAD